jgi:hypothetical protein
VSQLKPWVFFGVICVNICQYKYVDKKKRLNNTQKLQKISSQLFTILKNISEHYGTKVKKHPFFKTIFGFSFLDIYRIPKNVHFSKPKILFGKYL